MALVDELKALTAAYVARVEADREREEQEKEPQAVLDGIAEGEIFVAEAEARLREKANEGFEYVIWDITADPHPAFLDEYSKVLTPVLDAFEAPYEFVSSKRAHDGKLHYALLLWWGKERPDPETIWPD